MINNCEVTIRGVAQQEENISLVRAVGYDGIKERSSMTS